MKNDIFNKFNGKTNEEFLELLIRADKEPVIDGTKMPGFPDLEFQKNSVGSRGANDLKLEPYRFTSAVRKYAKQLGVAINENAKLLDFGVGWGRMIRFFFKDLPSDNLFGTDTWSLMVDKCNQLLPSGNYFVNKPHPPTEFADNTFDIIIAYSVFSHLRADAAEMWIKEFSRILKPNGIVVATTQGIQFLDLIEQIQKNPKQTENNNWHRSLLNGFGAPIEEYRKKYSNGEFLYAPTGGGDALDNSFYGEAVVPEKYVKEIFGKHLVFRNFSEDKNSQAVFVLQKPQLEKPVELFLEGQAI
ncbi:MAG: class I SAM-dependent methyltransferase [Fibromonadaceae bacterium]|jgi:ubiquinone/menaquinone biosynthesis C-methylase UbiE|nr:class I SAM-dependent methyltransferase [Fibromonadaceae bacterium]